MRPCLRLAYLDETEYWDDAIAKLTGRIAGVYIYDTHLRVHCCEITPSYELYLVGYLTAQQIDDDVQMAMAGATDAGHITYVHCWQVDGFRRARRRPGYRDIDPFAPERMPCTLSLPGPHPADRDAAIAEALEALPQCGFTTT